MTKRWKDDSEPRRLAALRRHLVGLCRSQGPIPFAQYMETCLYHPNLGYYSAGPPPMGPEGDYVTYPSAHPAFGRLVARQIEEMWEVLSRPDPFTLVEMGGGRGSLAVDILEGLRRENPQLYESLDGVLIDESPGLRRLQERAASPFARVRTLTPGAFFRQGASMTGCILANELVDALPVHLVERRGGQLQEVYVDVEEDEIREVLGPPSDPRIADFLDALDAHLEENQRTEVHLAAVDWIQKVGRRLDRGFVITLDFGYPAPEYFHPLRAAGTLMAYRDHRASPDPYALPGGEDLCAHVNFSALIRAGRAAGLEPTGLVPQDRFLQRLGLLGEMEALEERRGETETAAFWKEKLSLRRLLMPQPPQGGFQVLIQHKGVPRPRLRGLS